MIRKSKKRDAIYDALRGTDRHPSAEWIYAALKPQIPDLSLGTVYSNLAAFKRAGMAVSVGTVDGKERFDGNVAPHAHLICRVCGGVTDIHSAALPDPPVVAGIIEGCQVNWQGVCQKCFNNK